MPDTAGNSESPAAWAAVLRTSNGAFLQVEHRQSRGDEAIDVVAFESLRQGLDYFERGFARSHNRGAEASASATLAWMTLRPIIIPVSSLDWLYSLLVRKESGAFAVYALSGVATRGISGLAIKPEALAELEQIGTTPDLIRNDMLQS